MKKEGSVKAMTRADRWAEIEEKKQKPSQSLARATEATGNKLN
jgi:hypothetical protein